LVDEGNLPPSAKRHEPVVCVGWVLKPYLLCQIQKNLFFLRK
jgi:hypothetical protein